jgi:peptidoglycan hydrolase-like protein with peptidoglycan-binding domain
VSKGYLDRQYITGYYGPLTQASINKYNTALNTRVPLTTCTTTPVTPITTTCTTLPTYALSLYRGITHPNVKTLQQYLNANGYTVSITGPGSTGNETSYYGPATANAVTRFNNTNRCSTTPTTSTLNLSYGMTHPDIRTLQQYLNSKGYTVSITGPGSTGNETNYFGPATLQALTRFQKASGIIGEEGRYGEGTRAKVGN